VKLLALLAATIAVLASGLPAASASVPTGPPACKWKWKKKKVVKKVKRKGKVKRVVRWRKRPVCVPVPPPAPARIGVGAFEFYFILSATRLKAGDTIAELNNRGEDPHDLHISRLDGSSEVVIPETGPLTYARVRFDTQPGTYRLWCSLPFHAERGMDANVEVTP
jgi:plastocyanin